jgi:hypothetical protein
MSTTFNFQFTVPDGKIAEVRDLIGALNAALQVGVEGTHTEHTQTTPTTATATTSAPAQPAAPAEKTGPKVASVNQIAAIHAIYIDLGKKTGKTLNKEERIAAVKAMLNLTTLDSIDNLTSWQASKVITALKSSQGGSTEPF